MESTSRTVSRDGVIITPSEKLFNDIVYEGSLQQLLFENVGEYISVNFLIGTETMITKNGILYFVGRTYIVLYSPPNKQYEVCDFFSIKFVTFYQGATNGNVPQ